MIKSRYISTIISETDQEGSEIISDILKKFEVFGFKSVQVALVKHGKVPEFSIPEFDEPYTYQHETIEKATDIRNGLIIPEMTVLNDQSLRSLTSCLFNLDEGFKSTRDLTVCYWYKIPLIGIVITQTENRLRIS